MKNPLIQFINILVVTILVLMLYSNSKIVISFFGLDLKKTSISAAIRDDTKETLYFKTDTLNSAGNQSDTAKKQARVMDSTVQKILLFGDSMAGGLMFRLNQYCAENGHELQSIVWTSATIQAYTANNRLQTYIERYHPTYLLVSLGSNELFTRDMEGTEKQVKKLLGLAGNLKIIWVGPPNWKKDFGFNDVVEKTIGSDRFFPSKNLTYERQRDGAHPTLKSFDKWVDSLAVWIENKSLYPIKMHSPTEEYDVKLNMINVNGK